MNKASELWIRGVERVTGIEPALSAWEAAPSGPVTRPDLRTGLSASDRERPLVTGINGPLMARLSSSDLYPGGLGLASPSAVNPTALAARGAMVQSGSGWTSVLDRSSGYDAARR